MNDDQKWQQKADKKWVDYFAQKNSEESDEKLYARLLKAIKNHETNNLRRRISTVTTAMLNQPDDFGFTPLQNAVVTKNDKAVQLLLESGKVDVNATTPVQHHLTQPVDGWGPLPEEAAIGGETALHLAARRGYGKIAGRLFANPKTDLSIQDAAGLTAAERAEAAGHHDLAKLISSSKITDEIIETKAEPYADSPRLGRRGFESDDRDYSITHTGSGVRVAPRNSNGAKIGV